MYFLKGMFLVHSHVRNVLRGGMFCFFLSEDVLFSEASRAGWGRESRRAGGELLRKSSIRTKAGTPKRIIPNASPKSILPSDFSVQVKLLRLRDLHLVELPDIHL